MRSQEERDQQTVVIARIVAFVAVVVGLGFGAVFLVDLVRVLLD